MVSEGRLSPETGAAIAGLTALRSLSIDAALIEPEVVAATTGLPHLTALSLSGVPDGAACGGPHSAGFDGQWPHQPATGGLAGRCGSSSGRPARPCCALHSPSCCTQRHQAAAPHVVLPSFQMPLSALCPLGQLTLLQSTTLQI